ncbi:alcohol dehydrogenase catalytic domain-containing protein [Frankia sp. CNm7]|uniref:alcohol dehydrogenase n=1 Tax=Frankia nepalensis TaxID=1836974 RepID=A0A937RV23_9ACTN|nr:alcohol dehydrogenase catalytic domain-containing protein [Frankia nepalensis]MBL7495158.1 alcohol dehydrogenase catalytic domain-containing protein [Frankia nepalensis]MBL7515609.1 alcohol dehydrogenase catalytic domain-containing protein [Frankia nepalensis]MBL7524143.1 alcohol dehydrogenase catalytic domain-containing protein [Frankia nepalensis]MBL7632411.1 alcohol dehydrogenase catalytic domain-containing protein [Frankia nepalensis]
MTSTGATRLMPAYRINAWLEQPRMVDVPVPEPGPGEVLVAVAANGLCHSDLTMSQIPGEIGAAIGWRVPFTLGHEIAGTVAELGPETADAPPVGTGVALVSPASCGRCSYCLAGRDSACPNGLAGRGYGRDGGLARYVVAPVRALIRLDGLDPVAAAPLTDAGATSYHAVRRVLPVLEPGSTAVVLGAGGLGGFAIQHLKACSPARVVAVDTSKARLVVARELGADDTVVGVGGEPGEAGKVAGLLREASGGGAAAVLDFVGTDATIAAGIGAVRPTGAFGLVGSGGGTLRAPWYGGLPREAEVFTFQGSTIADARAVVALAAAGRIRSLVEVFTLDTVADAYRALDEGALRGRAVVTP